MTLGIEHPAELIPLVSNLKQSTFNWYTILASISTVQYELCGMIFLLKEYNLSYFPFKGEWEWGRAGPDSFFDQFLTPCILISVLGLSTFPCVYSWTSHSWSMIYICSRHMIQFIELRSLLPNSSMIVVFSMPHTALIDGSLNRGLSVSSSSCGENRGDPQGVDCRLGLSFWFDMLTVIIQIKLFGKSKTKLSIPRAHNLLRDGCRKQEWY